MGGDDYVLDEELSRGWASPTDAMNWYREQLFGLVELLDETGVLQLEDDWAKRIQVFVAAQRSE